jgi:hypothetical protein
LTVFWSKLIGAGLPQDMRPLRAQDASAVPVRAADHAAEIAAVEVRILVGDDIGLDVAEGRFGLVLDAIVEGLDDILLEIRRARKALTTASRSASEYCL